VAWSLLQGGLPIADDNRMLYETHMHTPLCKHAFGSPEDYGEVARARGLTGITVTCHNPLPDGIGAKIRMDESEWPLYLDLVARAREAMAPDIDVRLGLEADYMSGLEPFLRKQLASAPFDYVLGSVHWHMAEWQHRFWVSDSLRQLYTVYFEQLALAAESGLFDCLAHPDLIKNVSPSRWDFEEHRDLIETALDRVAATGMAMELNTSGRLKSIGEFNPGKTMLECMKARDIPVVVGSDAHTPERVGDAFEDAFELLLEVGYTNISLFSGRKRYEVPLTEALASLRAGPKAVL
jgi:histidinol-phosphatase (PHP family)